MSLTVLQAAESSGRVALRFYCTGRLSAFMQQVAGRLQRTFESSGDAGSSCVVREGMQDMDVNHGVVLYACLFGLTHVPCRHGR